MTAWPGPNGEMTPLRYRVVGRRTEAPDTVSLKLAPLEEGIGTHAPGQFTMVYAFGIGEIPISISGGADGQTLVHTLRAVGAVSRALHDARVGTVLGIRGPYGAGWDLAAAEDRHAVVIGGGIGLAPLRSVIREVLRHRDRYRGLAVLVGARTPADLLYPGEYDGWREAGADVLVTVDRPGDRWTGSVGVVPTLLDEVDLDPAATTAFLCGPEVMMRFSAVALRRRDVPAAAIQVSLERNMRCAVAWCGHCQLGPLLVCRDGPVVRYDVAEALLAVKEL